MTKHLMKLALAAALAFGAGYAVADGYYGVEVLVPETTQAEAAVPVATTIATFGIDGDNFSLGVYVDGMLTAVNSSGMSGAVAYLCGQPDAAGAVPINVTDIGSFALWREAGNLTVAGAEGSGIEGRASVAHQCPMPGADKPVCAFIAEHWTDRRHGGHAFHSDHLRPMMEVCAAEKWTIIGREALKGFNSPDDRPAVEQLLDTGLATFMAMTIEVDGMKYMAVAWCSACQGGPYEPVKLIHQGDHGNTVTVPATTTYRAPAAQPAPQPQPSGPDPLLFRCTDCN